MAGISAVASAVTPALGQVADTIQRQRAQSQAQQAAERSLETERQARERQLDLLRQEQSVASAQLRRGQAETLRGLNADTRNRLTQIDETATTDETQRRDALRSAMARTRASLGARGIGTADGSGAAVLSGLVGEADQERQASQAGDRLRRQALTQPVDDQRRRNLLEQTQLAERQRLELLSRLY